MTSDATAALIVPDACAGINRAGWTVEDGNKNAVRSIATHLRFATNSPPRLCNSMAREVVRALRDPHPGVRAVALRMMADMCGFTTVDRAYKSLIGSIPSATPPLPVPSFRVIEARSNGTQG